MRTKLLQTKKHFVCNNSLLRAPVSDTYNSAYQLVFIYIKTKIIKAETLKKKKEIKKKKPVQISKKYKKGCLACITWLHPKGNEHVDLML